jgi:predicted anti-sigma-YlaC factor YlaD
MTPECRELEVLRSIHAAGGLEGDEAARVAAHLEACAACRDADLRDRELLGLVKLPAPTPAEALAWADLPGRTLGALRRRERRVTWLRRLGAGAGIAALAAAAMLALLWPHAPTVPAADAGRTGHAAAVTVAQDDGTTPFFEDDLDVDDDASSSSSASSTRSSLPSSTEIALAAYDAGTGD